MINTIGSTIIIVFMCIASIALAGLCALVWKDVIKHD